MSELHSLFKSVKLPMMSEVAHELISTLSHEDTPIEKLRALLARDPALTAKVMRLANSAGFGMQRQIDSIEQAIALTGTAQIRILALTACMNVAFPDVKGLERIEFWRYCLTCAGYADWLAAELKLNRQHAWLCGMMVRLGELLIGQHAPAKLAEIEKQPQLPGERWKREQKLLSFTEAHVTAELARLWDFPDTIVRALDCVSEPQRTRPFNRMGAVVHLAGWLADMPFLDPIVIDVLPGDVLDPLGLKREWLRSHLPDSQTFFDVSAL
ncbi:MAG: HDOD domain-containing protein [Hylemonella sp.]|nr:HDOD domain-containing protein [Hylemonella sp.]